MYSRPKQSRKRKSPKAKKYIVKSTDRKTRSKNLRKIAGKRPNYKEVITSTSVGTTTSDNSYSNNSVSDGNNSDSFDYYPPDTLEYIQASDEGACVPCVSTNLHPFIR